MNPPYHLISKKISCDTLTTVLPFYRHMNLLQSEKCELSSYPTTPKQYYNASYL